MKDKWKAILVIEKSDVGQMDAAINEIRYLGIHTVHIFAQAGVRISQRYDHALHQDAAWDTPYKLWKGAAETAGNVYASGADLFLVCRPGCIFWKQLPEYCERTINRNVVAVWSPLTPNRVFPSENIQRPRCAGKMRWCETPVHADVETHHCFVVTGHVLSLMGFYLPEREEGAPVGCTLAEQLGRRNVPYMFHLPSLVDHEDINQTANDFVGCINLHLNADQMQMHQFDFEKARKK